ncbi:serine/arginine repetitive matrix protein 1-like [Zea mays]|uniref:Transducin family protein / WD-40 repeat family protein n=1 Tax=Zea mays TaxID=4577 RepID=A0A1D6GNF2_MAIZE|nr:serine/arginine repetitive matrix protein 1-like [Zea mays]AQK64761.1 transducin family protein / WD-40 repeat family protein [Zea mays]
MEGPRVHQGYTSTSSSHPPSVALRPQINSRWSPQLDTVEMKLEEAHSRLARFRDRKPPPTRSEPKPPTPPIQREHNPSPPPIQRDLKPSLQPPIQKAPSPAPQPSARPQLVIPRTSNRPTPRPEPMPGLKRAAAPSSSSSPAPPERSRKEEKKPKIKMEQKGHPNLITSVGKSSATVFRFQGRNLVSSQHRRKLMPC